MHEYLKKTTDRITASISFNKKKLQKYFRHFGLRGVLFFWGEKFVRHLSVKVHASKNKPSLCLRLNASDLKLYINIFKNNEYDFNLIENPKVIIDAGANIGISAIFFSQKFPKAKVYAIEPEQHNFNLLLKNTIHYPNIRCIRAGLWNKNERIKLYDRRTGDWGFAVLNQERNDYKCIEDIRGITMMQIMKEEQIRHVDLFKIDIEGSEKELFQDSKNWIDRVDAIIIELHDRIKTGCSEAFYEATKHFKYKYTISDHVLVCRNNSCNDSHKQPLLNPA